MFVKATKVACSIKEVIKIAWTCFIKRNRKEKPRHEKLSQEKNNKNLCHSKFDPKAEVDRKTNPITDNDLDILADVGDGKCCIVLLMRKHDEKPNPDLNDVSFCIEVTTTEHWNTKINLWFGGWV